MVCMTSFTQEINIFLTSHFKDKFGFIKKSFVCFMLLFILVGYLIGQRICEGLFDRTDYMFLKAKCLNI